MPDVAVERGSILKLAAAGEAEPVVRRMVEAEFGVGGDAGVLDAVGEHRAASVAGQRGDGGIVDVENEGCGLGKLRNGGAPELRDGIDLAVAVKLVAEEVCEHDDARR